jgi:hypothetical protein
MIQQFDPADLLQIQAHRVFAQLHHQGRVVQEIQRLLLGKALQILGFHGEDLVIRFLENFRQLDIAQQVVEGIHWQVIQTTYIVFRKLPRGEGRDTGRFGWLVLLGRGVGLNDHDG